MRILILDIETAPTQAFVWGVWDQNVAMNQIIKPGYILSFAAKWLDEKAIYYRDLVTYGQDVMLGEIHDMLSEADIVISYNGKKFDIPTLNREFLLLGMNPPANYKQIDLLPIVRRQFKFPHNKLDYVAQALGLGGKLKHAGFDMWIGCMKGDVASWDMMKEYNREDVQITERLYNRIRPWINNHPNVGLHEDKEHVCPICGGIHVQKRGFTYTSAGKYQRYQCNDCGGWSRDKKTVAVKGLLAGVNV